MDWKQGWRLRYADPLGRFDIPPDTGVETALEVALGHIEEGVDRVLAVECGTRLMLTGMTLAEKVELLFSDTGYGDDPDGYDRHFWPDIPVLDEIRRQGRTEDVEELAVRWLDDDGCLDHEDVPGLPDRSDPQCNRMLFARMLNGLCAYADGWVEGYFDLRDKAVSTPR